MNITKKPKWKIVLIAGLCLIGILALTGSTLSIYMRNQAYQRGVARNRDNEVVRFTSNYMQACVKDTASSNYAGRTVLFSEEQKKSDTLSIDIYVYNYVNGTSQISQRDIAYTMKISIAGNEKGESYTVTYNNGQETTITRDGYSKSDAFLAGRTKNADKYIVTIPGAAVDRVKITATATPTELSVTNNQILAAVIAPCTAAETAAFSYTSSYTDQSGEPKDYAAFNYLISISSGKANATLTWKSGILEIDKYFLEKINKQSTDISISNNQNTLTFTMDQSDGTGEYLIPFYIKNKNTIQSATWENMKSYISFTAEQVQADSTATP